MKKKTKALILTLGLCIATVSLTACGSIGEIYDFFTDSAFGEMLENLDELDTEDIKNIIENLDESDFEGLLDDLSDAGKNNSIENSNYSYDYETADEDNTTAASETFDLGNVDGNIYSNSFLGLMCEFDTSWHYYTDEELTALNNSSIDFLQESDDPNVKMSMELGSIYTIMFVENSETSDNVGITVQCFNFNISDYYSLEELIDSSLPSLQVSLTAQGLEDISVVRSTVSFMGEIIPCIEIVGYAYDVPIYMKQIFIIVDNYFANITVTSITGEESTQEYLDAFSTY